MSVLAFIIGFLMSYDAATMQEDRWDVDEVDGSIDVAIKSAAAEENFPTTTLELLGRIALKQRQLNNEIIREYGAFGKDVFNAIFVEKIIKLSAMSKTKLQRKLMIKIVLGRIRQESDEPAPKFNWVTVGDSSAAGYGNTYSQSYTSILQNTVSSIFLAAGIEFVASNRANDVFSGMEVAFCTKQILGPEADAISWEFTPKDSNYFDALSNSQGLDPLLFGERVGLAYYPQLPFIYLLGRATGIEMQEQFSSLENRGFGYAMMMDTLLREVILTLPNGNDDGKGSSRAAVVSKFHCNGAIEGVELCDNLQQMHQCYSNEGSECTNMKYDVPNECKDPRYQTPWNDGFKMHRLKGRLLSYHLIEMLRLATLELDLLELKQPQLKDNPSEALELLQNVEDAEGFLFLKTTTAASSTEDSSWEWLKTKKSDCLNTMSLQQHSDTSAGFPPIEHHPQALCEEFVPFQTAFFRISDKEHRIRLDSAVQQSQGLSKFSYGICFHTSRCDTDQCDIDDTLMNNGSPITVDTVQITVHGELVSGLQKVGGCHFLANKEGLEWRGETGRDAIGEITIRSSQPLFVSSIFVLQ